jgi:hypothetical protein
MKRYVAPLTLIASLSAWTSACDKAGAKATEQSTTASDEAKQKATSAQAQAGKEIVAAQTDFAKAREDYRHGRWTDIADLDKKVAVLQSREQTAIGKVRSDLDAILPTIRAKRDVFVRDMQALDSATGTTWDTMKTDLDKEWDGLKATVDGAP